MERATSAVGEQLAGALKLGEDVKMMLFVSKLTVQMQRDLVFQERETYQQNRDEAIRLDSSYRAIGGEAKTGKKKKKAHQKCTKCGRTNHETKDCFAKPKVQMISLSRQRASIIHPTNQVDITIGGKELEALIDTGSEVNCIRAELIGKEGIRTHRPTDVRTHGTSPHA